MKNIVRALIVLSVCFASAKLQAATLLDCKNSSTHSKMTLTTGGVITYINKSTTVSNISISTSVTSIQVKPTGAIAIPITIQKSALNIGTDGKYDLEIRTTLSGTILNVKVYSLGEKVAEKNFTFNAF